MSAITHIGEVREVEEGGDSGGKYRLIAFGDQVKEEAVVMKLEEPKKREIESFKERNILLCSFVELKKAKTYLIRSII